MPVDDVCGATNSGALARKSRREVQGIGFDPAELMNPCCRRLGLFAVSRANVG